MLSLRHKNILKHWRLLLVLIVMVAGMGEVKGQRKYATAISKISATTGVNITNESNAITNNENNAPTETPPLANITVTGTGGLTGSSASGWIGLGFSSIPSNTIVFIKVSSPIYANAGGTINAQAYNNTSLVTSTSTLITAADGTLYYTVTANATFNTVRLNVTGNGGLIPGAGTVSINVLSAFYNTTNSSDCGIVLGTDGYNVSNPQRAIDGIKTTFSTLTPGALLSSANQNFYFSSPSNSSDEVKLTLSAPAAALSVTLLNNITVSAYNGSSSTAVWSMGLGNILSADLLGLLSNATPVTFSIAPGVAFDRVTVNFGSVLSLFSNLYIHEIERTPKKPSFTPISLQNVTACAGIPITLTPDAPAAGNTFKWYDSASDGALLSTGSSYMVSPLVSTTYYVATSKSTCTGESIRIPVNVTVNSISGGVIATDQTICNNSIPAPFTSTAAATITSGGTAATYQWQKSTDNNTFTNITSNATNVSYTETATLTQTTYYRRVATSTLNSVACSANSNVITVTVNSITAGTIGTNQTICLGSAPAAFTSLTGATGTGTTTYQWQKSTDNNTFTNIASAIAATYTETAAPAQTTYYRRVATSTLNTVTCSANSASITVTVAPIPSITVGTIANVCQETATTTLPYSATTGSPTTYSIVWNAYAMGKGFTNVNGATLTASPIIINKPVGTTVTPGSYSGTLTVSNANCTSSSQPITFTVLPRPATPNLILTTNPQ